MESQVLKGICESLVSARRSEMAQTGVLGGISGPAASYLPLAGNGPRSSHSRSAKSSSFLHLHQPQSTSPQSTYSAFQPKAFPSHPVAGGSQCGFLAGDASSISAFRSVPIGWRHGRGKSAIPSVRRGARADYYQTLGVSKSASKAEIKSAYRKLARQVGRGEIQHADVRHRR